MRTLCPGIFTLSIHCVCVCVDIRQQLPTQWKSVRLPGCIGARCKRSDFLPVLAVPCPRYPFHRIHSVRHTFRPIECCRRSLCTVYPYMPVFYFLIPVFAHKQIALISNMLLTYVFPHPTSIGAADIHSAAKPLPKCCNSPIHIPGKRASAHFICGTSRFMWSSHMLIMLHAVWPPNRGRFSCSTHSAEQKCACKISELLPADNTYTGHIHSIFAAFNTHKKWLCTKWCRQSALPSRPNECRTITRSDEATMGNDIKRGKMMGQRKGYAHKGADLFGQNKCIYCARRLPIPLYMLHICSTRHIMYGSYKPASRICLLLLLQQFS